MKLLLLFSLISFLVCLGEATKKPCDANWEAYKDEKCFRVLDGLLNFTDAQASCGAQDGAKLVSIGSAEEEAFLEKYLFTKEKVLDTLWLGANYKGGKFTWQDGSNLTYSNWATGNPKNREDYCVMMNSEDELKGKWTDVLCGKKNLVVCQKGQSLSLEALKKILYDLRKEYLTTMTFQESMITQLSTQITQLNESKVTQATQIAQLEANPLPLGFIYVQLPMEKAPSDIWPSMTWTEVSATYAGVFFRVSGGGASDFGAIQEENAPRLTQVEWNTCPYSPTNTCENIKSTNLLSIPRDGTWSDDVKTADRYVGNIEGIDDSKLRTFMDYIRFQHSAGEVRPRNMAVKVWKRVE